jgi:cell division septum initiation protein DivIVA
MYVHFEREQCDALIELVERRINEIQRQMSNGRSERQIAKLSEELQQNEALLHCLHEAGYDVSA